MMELFYLSRDPRKKMSLLLNFYQTKKFGSVSMISMRKEYSPTHMENRQLTSIGVPISLIIWRTNSTLSILMVILKMNGMILTNRNRNPLKERSTLSVFIFPSVNEENKSESIKNIFLMT